MTSPTEPTAIKGVPPIYQLKVVLLESKPVIWRRLQVPGNANLGWLHAVLQVAVGWTNSHLHLFMINGDTYSAKQPGMDQFSSDRETFDERKFTLQQVAPTKGHAFGYEYDFGDSWMHELVVEAILPPNPAAAGVASCLDGARACPPEDCGGLWGYADLLKALKNPKHREHQAMKEWVGEGFDPEAFDAVRANFWLRKLKWPHVTEDQLRKALMGRDNYRG